jgi:hypothetical protein
MVMKPDAAKTAQLQSLLRQGFQALNRGKVQQASDYCRQILGIQPDLVEGHFLVGLVALVGDQVAARSSGRMGATRQAVHR